MLPPFGFTFVCWPATLSDIPKGLLASLTRRFALNSKTRGLATWRAEMPAAGAKMHPQLKMGSDGMAAVDMQAMEEKAITTFFETNWSLKSAPEFVAPRQGKCKHASR